MRLTAGRVGTGLLLPTALLQRRGARTGCVRRNAIIYFHDGDWVTVIASQVGRPEHSCWFHNARAKSRRPARRPAFLGRGLSTTRRRERGSGSSPIASSQLSPSTGTAGGTGRINPILQIVPR